MIQFLTFVPYSDVLTALGCKSHIAASRWVDRYNQRNPDSPVRRLHGKVCAEDLQAAIASEIARHAHRAHSEGQPDTTPARVRRVSRRKVGKDTVG